MLVEFSTFFQGTRASAPLPVTSRQGVLHRDSRQRAPDLSNLQNASLFLENAPLQQQCRVDSNIQTKNNLCQKCPSASSPGRQDAAPRRCCCQRPATAHLPAPQRPCHSLGSSRCSLVCFRARRARIRGELGLAPQQCSRSCTASAKCIANPTRRFPQTRVCDAPRLARPFLPHRPREPQRPHSELRRALHTART